MTPEVERRLPRAAFLPIGPASTALGVPESFLRQQIAEGKVPILKVGRRALVHIADAERALREAVATAGRPP